MNDVTAIQQLIAKLAIDADNAEIAEYLTSFTDDAVWEMDANTDRGIPADRRVGRDDIAASVQQRRGLRVQGPGSGAVHHLTTQVVDVTGDEATGHVYYQFLRTVDGAPTLQTLGQYRDRYRRTADGWKVTHRRIVIG